MKTHVRRDYAAEIMDRLTTQDVVEHYGFELNRSNNICCPFHHEKTPSLHIYPDGWYCFGCGKSGNAVGFVMELFGLSFIMAVRRINDDFHLGLLDDSKPHPVAAVPESREFDTETNGLIQAYEDNTKLLAEWQDVIDKADRNGNLWAGAVRYTGRLRLETEELQWTLYERGVRKGDNGSGDIVWYRWQQKR